VIINYSSANCLIAQQRCSSGSSGGGCSETWQHRHELRVSGSDSYALLSVLV